MYDQNADREHPFACIVMSKMPGGVRRNLISAYNDILKRWHRASRSNRFERQLSRAVEQSTKAYR